MGTTFSRQVGSENRVASMSSLHVDPFGVLVDRFVYCVQTNASMMRKLLETEIRRERERRPTLHGSSRSPDSLPEEVEGLGLSIVRSGELCFDFRCP